MCVSNITERGATDYSEIFRQVGYETRNNLEHFEDSFYPVDPGSIFLFSGSVLDSHIMENGQMDFHEIFRICWTQQNKIID